MLETHTNPDDEPGSHSKSTYEVLPSLRTLTVAYKASYQREDRLPGPPHCRSEHGLYVGFEKKPPFSTLCSEKKTNLQVPLSRATLMLIRRSGDMSVQGLEPKFTAYTGVLSSSSLKGHNDRLQGFL